MRLIARRPAPPDSLLRQAPSAVARPITASGAMVDLGDRSEVRRLRKMRQAWQEDAFTYRDAVPEVGYAMRFVRHAASRLRLFPAVASPDAEEPVTLEEAGIRGALATAAEDAVARLSSDTFLWGSLLEPLAELFSLVGEAALLGYTDEEDGQERWECRSFDELRFSDRGIILADLPGMGAKDGRLLPPDTFLARLWVPHPRYHRLADSPMRQLGTPCEELLLVSRVVRNSARSRIAGNGVMYISNDADLPWVPGVEEGQATTEAAYMAWLTETMLRPISDETDAASVVPVLMRGPAGQEPKHVTFDRPADDRLLARGAQALASLARGLDLPPEVVTGMGDINHWGAWAIDDQTFRNHLQGLAIKMVDALTRGYYRAALSAAGFAPEQTSGHVIWYDATLLTVRPNRAKDATDAWDRITISTERYLESLGFDPATDAPSPEEVEERKELLRVRRGNPGETAPDRTTPGPTTGLPEEASAAAVVGAAGPATPQVRERDSRRLVDIDRSLRERLHTAAEASLRRALERASNRVRGRAVNRADLRPRVAAAGQLATRTLGRAVVADLGVDDGQLLADAFEDLRPLHDRWTAAAQEDALATAARIAGIDLDSPALAARIAELRTQLTESRAASWAWLADRLRAVATARLYDPVAPEAGGESPADDVPYSLVRGAVALAGGLPATHPGLRVDGTPPETQPVGGVGTGDLVTGFLRGAGCEITGYEWVYGISVRHFQPHRRLDGVRFQDYGDPVLAHDGWPGPTLAPGEHAGCHCDAAPLWSDGASTAQAQEAVARATHDTTRLDVLREIASEDVRAGRRDTTPIRTVAEAERVARSRPSRR